MNAETLLNFYYRAKSLKPTPHEETAVAGYMVKPTASMPSLYQKKSITNTSFRGEWTVILVPECITVTCKYEKLIDYIPIRNITLIENCVFEYENFKWHLNLKNGQPMPV